MIFLVSTTKRYDLPEVFPQAKKCPSPAINCFGYPFSAYYIQIEDLTSLLSLIQDYPIIINRVDYKKDISDFEIEIYNGYRE